MFTRNRYQQGCLTREKRKSGPAVWVFRYRQQMPDATRVNRKIVVGTVTEFTKADALKAIEAIRIDINDETNWRPKTLKELVTHYEQKELPSKTPYTQDVYRQYLATWILPKWGERVLSDIKPVPVEEWLKSLALANGTKAKLRNLMSAVFRHAMRYEWTEKNPISLVRQSAKRQRTPDVLDVQEIQRLLVQLQEPYRTMVFLAAATGLRVSELLALKWSDIDFEHGEMNLSRGIVRQNIGEMKTEASRKPLALSAGLAEVLFDWLARCPYNQPHDWVFASSDTKGRQPYWPTSAMENHFRPAAERAGISKRVGWHCFRHSFGTLLKANGEDVKTVQESLRHASSKITLDVYTQAVTPAKREAQRKVVEMLRPVQRVGA